MVALLLKLGLGLFGGTGGVVAPPDPPDFSYNFQNDDDFEFQNGDTFEFN